MGPRRVYIEFRVERSRCRISGDIAGVGLRIPGRESLGSVGFKVQGCRIKVVNGVGVDELRSSGFRADAGLSG